MNYKQTLLANSNPNEAFNAVNEKLHLWWGNVDNPVNKLGDIFTITFGSAFWTFEITEYSLNKKVTWTCIDGQPELNNEWVGHQLTWKFELSEEKVMIFFEQDGLLPEIPCYDICSVAWDRFILKSLKDFLETGVGAPG